MAETSLAHDEVWRAIPGFEGLFSVSSLGRVRSEPKIVCGIRYGKPYQAKCEGKFITSAADPRDGWIRVRLRKEGTIRVASVARLVVAAFESEAASLNKVIFNDGDPENCSLDNLSSGLGTEQSGEVWRPVLGWEGYYDVSNTGRIRSHARNVLYHRADGKCRNRHVGARILNPTLTGCKKYRNLNLSVFGQRHRALVHVLVCEAFHGQRPPLHEACHIDGNSFNNSADNLRWGSKAMNERDKVIAGFARLTQSTVQEVEQLVASLNMKNA